MPALVSAARRPARAPRPCHHDHSSHLVDLRACVGDGRAEFCPPRRHLTHPQLRSCHGRQRPCARSDTELHQCALGVHHHRSASACADAGGINDLLFKLVALHDWIMNRTILIAVCSTLAATLACAQAPTRALKLTTVVPACTMPEGRVLPLAYYAWPRHGKPLAWAAATTALQGNSQRRRPGALRRLRPARLVRTDAGRPGQ
jgi:hypothetical protein